jgi:hypothetical protein
VWVQEVRGCARVCFSLGPPKTRNYPVYCSVHYCIPDVQASVTDAGRAWVEVALVGMLKNPLSKCGEEIYELRYRDSKAGQV